MNALTKGLIAGAAGTTAMTASQLIEIRLTGRAASDVPGQVAQELSGVKPSDPKAQAAMSTGMHWAHGLTGGAVRGAIGRTGATGPVAAALLFGGLWGLDVSLYKALGIADFPWRWSGDELATDVFHKGLYSVVTSSVYDALDS
jgi:hypothetical protein